MLLHLKKLLKKQIKIILVHKVIWLESIHVTFCVRKFYVLERQKINPFTLTKDNKLTFKLSVINLSFTKKVGGVEQKWTAQKFVHYVPGNRSNLN